MAPRFGGGSGETSGCGGRLAARWSLCCRVSLASSTASVLFASLLQPTALSVNAASELCAQSSDAGLPWLALPPSP
eukprot:365535-Chlamydomonas_euryale.AAC.95